MNYLPLTMKTFEEYLNASGEIGYVEEVSQSLVSVSGLPNAVPEEIILFEDGSRGQVFSLLPNNVKVLLFSKKPSQIFDF